MDEPGLMNSCNMVRMRCNERGVGNRKTKVLDVALSSAHDSSFIQR